MVRVLGGIIFIPSLELEHTTPFFKGSMVKGPQN